MAWHYAEGRKAILTDKALFSFELVFTVVVSPYRNRAGETGTLHLHSGPFGRSQTAPIGLYCCHAASTEWSVPTRYECEIRSQCD